MKNQVKDIVLAASAALLAVAQVGPASALSLGVSLGGVSAGTSVGSGGISAGASVGGSSGVNAGASVGGSGTSASASLGGSGGVSAGASVGGGGVGASASVGGGGSSGGDTGGGGSGSGSTGGGSTGSGGSGSGSGGGSGYGGGSGSGGSYLGGGALAGAAPGGGQYAAPPAMSQAEMLQWARAHVVGTTLVSSDGQTLGMVDRIHQVRGGLMSLSVYLNPALGLGNRSVTLRLHTPQQPSPSIRLGLTAAEFGHVVEPQLRS